MKTALLLIMAAVTIPAVLTAMATQDPKEPKSISQLTQDVQDLRRAVAEHEARLLFVEDILGKGKDQPAESNGKLGIGGSAPIEVKVTNKRFSPSDASARKYKDNIWWDVTYTSHLSKKTRSVKGVLSFCDLFGEEKYRVKVTVDTPIGPGASVTNEGIGIDYNQFLDEHVWLRSTELADMTFKFTPTAVLYSDGELVKY